MAWSGVAGTGEARAVYSGLPFRREVFPVAPVTKSRGMGGTARRGEALRARARADFSAYSASAGVLCGVKTSYGKASYGWARRGQVWLGWARADSAFSRFTEAVERCKSIMRHGWFRQGWAGCGMVRSGAAGAAGQRNGHSLSGHCGAKAPGARPGKAWRAMVGCGAARAVIRTGSPA